MTLILSENLENIPIIDIHRAQKHGEVENIRADIHHRKIIAFEFRKRIPVYETRAPNEAYTYETTPSVSADHYISTPSNQTIIRNNAKKLEPNMDNHMVQKTYEIPPHAIQSLSTDALLLKKNDYREIYESGSKEGLDIKELQKLHVYTESEKHLGKISNLIINRESLSLTAIELSEGFWRDWINNGQQYLLFPKKFSLDVIQHRFIIPDEYEDQLQDNFSHLMNL